MGVKYRILYRQDAWKPTQWHGRAIAWQEGESIILIMGRSELYPEVSSLEELRAKHAHPLPGRLRWGLTREWPESRAQGAWWWEAMRQPEPPVDLSLDDVRLAIWHWTPAEREALRRELAQEDDWSGAERAWQAMRAEDDARVEEALVYKQPAEPLLAPLAEEQTEYDTADE